MTKRFHFSLLLIVLINQTIIIKSQDTLQRLKNDIKSGRVPMLGVNLGGWLVAERWMTGSSPAWNVVPDHIAYQGEYQTMKYLGHERGDRQFKEHRDNFITEKDFQDIAAAKLNTVRIPISYWITGFDNRLGGDPNGWKVYAPDAINYLDRAIREWGRKYNVLVLISLHAAKGSQNGYDHSSPQNPGHTYWSQYPENVQNTLDAVECLARRYNNDTAFLGIALLNEPTESTNEQILKQYYYDAYDRIRTFSDCLLTVSPLLHQQGPYDSDWNRFMLPPQFHGIRHEWHPYHIRGFEGQNVDQILNFARYNLKNDITSWKGNWLFIGQWILASATHLSDNQLREYARTQLDAFKSATGGWTFWTWKFYNDDGSSKQVWSLISMLKHGYVRI